MITTSNDISTNIFMIQISLLVKLPSKIQEYKSFYYNKYEKNT